MKIALAAASFAVLGATSVAAGGIERANNNYGLLFTPGDQIELTFSHVKPTVSGSYSAGLTALGGSATTGNMANSYTNLGFGYKNDINDKLAIGLYVNQPYGADAAYTSGFYKGLAATWESSQIAALAKYKLADRISVYGGARYVRSSANISIPDQMIRGKLAGISPAHPGLAAPAGTLRYDAKGEQDGQWGYVLGAAYEIPEIAMRVGLTWESAMTHNFTTTETVTGLGVNATGKTKVEMPQSVALDFQTGVAAGTLVFGQIKWTEWSKWEVRPPAYNSVANEAITGFDNDTTTYRLGVGRQFNEQLSGFAQVTYEKKNGGIASRLAPTDGRQSIGIGMQYTKDNMKIRGGLEYAQLGDAVDGTGTQFKGNSATGFGLSVTFGF
ncbi:OmpP1/FadL family transporter [Pseudoprimorskyibacter insulae]|uniref:Outer membrane protein n=1 Tax=Pseudoprimorskyibacter insulae TaxID=1695997 RepID=A0A2R8AWX2_9RHOB|nr:outer membrane protein transport protein [Pseudoprimorskyibacter insulae]SPF80437.1 Putative outer membrane protein [Pseudoprimorskyibacter insulae]